MESGALRVSQENCVGPPRHARRAVGSHPGLHRQFLHELLVPAGLGHQRHRQGEVRGGGAEQVSRRAAASVQLPSEPWDLRAGAVCGSGALERLAGGSRQASLCCSADHHFGIVPVSSVSVKQIIWLACFVERQQRIACKARSRAHRKLNDIEGRSDGLDPARRREGRQKKRATGQHSGGAMARDRQGAR